MCGFRFWVFPIVLSTRGRLRWQLSTENVSNHRISRDYVLLAHWSVCLPAPILRILVSRSFPTVLSESPRARQLSQFFKENREKLAPSAIYRAKAWGRLEKGYQLDFVDVGLMPLVEEEAGRRLTDLVERIVAGAKKQLGWKNVSVDNGVALESSLLALGCKDPSRQASQWLQASEAHRYRRGLSENWRSTTTASRPSP